MKKFTKMLAFASLASLAIFAGCSESEEPDPTKAELCAAGATQECLLGVWSFDGVKSMETGTFFEGMDFTAAPGALEFYIDKDKRTGAKTPMFKLSLAPGDVNYGIPDCNPVEGEFDVIGTTVKMKTLKNAMCVSSKTLTFEPKVTNNGAKIELQVGKLWLTKNQIAEKGIGEATQAFYTEVYSANANATK